MPFLPFPVPADSLPRIMARLQYTSNCRRCGECCRRGGPSLHHEDLDLIRAERLEARDLICFRPGEPVVDNVRGILVRLENDLIKIKGLDTGLGCCMHYDAQRSSCGIYASRPLQCRLLDCRNPAALMEAYERDRLQRSDLMACGSGLNDLVAWHEEKFSWSRVRTLVEGGKDLQNDLLRLALDEHAFRQILLQKLDVEDQDLWYCLGRPLHLALRPMSSVFGLRPVQARFA